VPTLVRSLISLTFCAQWTNCNAGMVVSFANPTLVYDCRSYDTFAVFKFVKNCVETGQGARYNIKNEVVIGALLLPSGLGSACTSL
jgi:hypothetical protein